MNDLIAGPSQYQTTIHQSRRGAYLSIQRLAPDGQVFTLGFGSRGPMREARDQAASIGFIVVVQVEG